MADLDKEQLETVVSDLPTDAMQDANEIEMLESKESWSVYRLADGTTLRIKPVMIAVFVRMASKDQRVSLSTI